MSCPTSTVPGLDESGKIKDPALAAKINALIKDRQMQVKAGVISEQEKRMSFPNDLNKIAPGRKTKQTHTNFTKLEAEVRNTPIAYNEGIGPSTRKGDLKTERLIKTLRDQEVMGVITKEERRQALIDEVNRNNDSFQSYLNQPKGLMGYG
tara:strand:+ start:111 stop:563 length:453 start_codon:yes stop_codon:yes gene_type:complete